MSLKVRTMYTLSTNNPFSCRGELRSCQVLHPAISSEVDVPWNEEGVMTRSSVFPRMEDVSGCRNYSQRRVIAKHTLRSRLQTSPSAAPQTSGGMGFRCLQLWKWGVTDTYCVLLGMWRRVVWWYTYRFCCLNLEVTGSGSCVMMTCITCSVYLLSLDEGEWDM
jgi:hypothetical protein